MGKYIFSAVIIIAAILTVNSIKSNKNTVDSVIKNATISRTVLSEQNKSFGDYTQMYACIGIKKPRH